MGLPRHQRAPCGHVSLWVAGLVSLSKTKSQGQNTRDWFVFFCLLCFVWLCFANGPLGIASHSRPTLFCFERCPLTHAVGNPNRETILFFSTVLFHYDSCLCLRTACFRMTQGSELHNCRMPGRTAFPTAQTDCPISAFSTHPTSPHLTPPHPIPAPHLPFSACNSHLLPPRG